MNTPPTNQQAAEVERARVYTPAGRMAHLLRPLDSPNSTVPSLCGRWPGAGDFWLGTGSQREREEAAKRPLCTQCEQRAMTPTLIREI